MRNGLLLMAMLVFCVAAAGGARAQALCGPGETDQATRPLPAALVPQAEAVFGLQAMPASMVQATTVIRCAGGRMLACNVGANLPCGKANTNRALPGADGWCAQNPGAAFIPAYVTGHDTVYQWSCQGSRAVPHGPRQAVDAQGYLMAYWKPLT